MKKFLISAAVAALVLGTTGCMFHGGSPHNVTNTTLGQELTDLKIALEEGAISEPEYVAMKAELMEARKKSKSHHEH
jgi:outer membrane lipopolysaccharide assembly protein LptE/RlpB